MSTRITNRFELRSEVRQLLGNLFVRLSALSVEHEMPRFFERHQTFAETPAACDRPEWMVQLALHARIDRRRLVALVSPVVERSLARHGLQVGALAIAWHWVRGNVDGAAAWAAGFQVSERAKQAPGLPANALRAAAALAFACDPASSPIYHAVRAHRVDAVALATRSTPGESGDHAETLRRSFPPGAIEAGEERAPSRSSGEPPRQRCSWWSAVAATGEG